MFSFQEIPAFCTALGQRAAAQFDLFEKEVIRARKRTPIQAPQGIRIGREIDKGGALYSTRSYDNGEVVFAFRGSVKRIEDATPLALQVGENLFLEAEQNDPFRFDEFTNHSCNPNGVVGFRSGRPYFVAGRDIADGEELTFNYNTTEYDMFEQEEVMKAPCVFKCNCKTSHCLGRIMGFRYLSIEQKLTLRAHLSPYLAEKLKAELNSLRVVPLNFEP
ncbi:MAG: SET domain-containing protein-lysine N-methyltransferase [Candidatus Melainabacteria bacterium]|nr:SET domain-containing protein-lysine N-methyltransferase [Candidatus Melainabacteria bacterium]